MPNLLSRNMLLIARREYMEKVRGRAFRLTTVLLPVAFLVMVGAATLIQHRSSEGRHVAIVADNAALGNDVRGALLTDKNAQFTVDVVSPATGGNRAALLQRVRSEAIDGFLWIEQPPSGAATASYTSRSSSDALTVGRLRTALNRGLVEERLTASGISAAEAETLTTGVSIRTLQVNGEGKATKSSGNAPIYKGLIMAFLLTMTTLLYGLDAARSIVEEKTSRIFEVMLAVVRPDDLLAGKLIGVGAVGLTQIAIWVLAAGVLMGSAFAAPLLTGQLDLHFSWVEGVLLPLFFVLGFFLYSAFFSGLAATCETAQELQMYMPLAAAPVWLSFAIIPLLMRDPGSVWALAASFFPLTSPFVMTFRIGLLMPPAWQLAASIGILVLSVWFVLWFSTRLYRVGILMYGKRATLPEVMRWLRYS
jgi:ABC-2 type transport system permease protein